MKSTSKRRQKKGHRKNVMHAIEIYLFLCLIKSRIDNSILSFGIWCVIGRTLATTRGLEHNIQSHRQSFFL